MSGSGSELYVYQSKCLMWTRKIRHQISDARHLLRTDYSLRFVTPCLSYVNHRES